MHDLITHLLTVENLIALLTLTLLEIVLGIDNIIFLSILTGKLPPEDRRKGRLVGLALAMGARICLLLGITWVMGLTRTLFTAFGQEISGQDLVLILGGCFLIYKSTKEIHHKLEGGDELTKAGGGGGGGARFSAIIVQIILVDLVFSLDSVITAVGMVKTGGGHGEVAAAAAAASQGAEHAKLAVMILAVMIAVGVMMVFAGIIGDFVERHPTIKVLALSFLIMVGLMLVGEGFGQHISKGYIYFAMAFSLAVEVINIRMRPKDRPSVGGITGRLAPGEHIDLGT
jgi:predicted tellurium resistance membrane protein TerC